MRAKVDECLNFIEQHGRIIISQTFIYAFILIFPAFGPVLNNIAGVDNGVVIGSVFLGFLIIGIVMPPFKFEMKKVTFRTYIIIGIVITLLFPMVGMVVKLIIVAFLGCISGRHTMYWCQLFFFSLIKETYGIIIGILLFSSYFLLYISNGLVPSMSPFLAAIWASLFLIGSLIFHPIAYREFNHGPTVKVKSIPYKNLIAISLVFITAGTTYAGIYPTLQQYNAFERFYNVLPFLFAALAAGFISEKKGRRMLIYYGIGFLGLAFIFKLISPEIITYFLIQTSLQIGWAFLDAYAWITGADFAKKNKQPMIIAYFVASFLLGTFLGSVINIGFNDYLVRSNDFLGASITYLPLFIALFVVILLPETKPPSVDIKNVRDIYNEEWYRELFYMLTLREKEVAVLLLEDMTNQEISKKLYISPNTLKKHAKNVYKKMNVNNKRELKNLVKTR